MLENGFAEYIESLEEILNQFQTTFQEFVQESFENEPRTLKTIEKLDHCEDLHQILDFVKATVTEILGESRSDIVLAFQNLPLHVGAYHPADSNWIVMNKRLFDVAYSRLSSQNEINSFIFAIILHEYLHTLGYLNEYQVRRLGYEICKRALGKDHPATRMAKYGPWEVLLNNLN